LSAVKKRKISKIAADIARIEKSFFLTDDADLRIPTKSPGCTDMKSPEDSETMSPTFPI
jgi:hypothetical protein